MKLIFLDIDGVLINRAACMRGFGLVDPDCVAQLNRVIAETGAYLVMSSTWRMGKNIAEIKDQLLKWGVIGKLLDKTPYFMDKDRGDEIQAWLTNHADIRGDIMPVEKFVILDDDRDMCHLLPFLIKSTMEHGLTEELANQAIVRLNS